jgi:hypothetical protein
MLIVDVEGEPVTTGLVPWLTPSSLKSTVPEGGSAPVPASSEVIAALTVKVAPPAGVFVDGVTVVEVELGCTSTTTDPELAGA